MKTYYDSSARGSKQYEIGDLVLLHQVPPRNTQRKLWSYWRGPYIVIKQITEVNYRVKLMDDKKIRLVVHTNRLKPFHQRDGVRPQVDHPRPVGRPRLQRPAERPTGKT